MTQLPTRIVPHSEQFQANAAALEGQIAQLRALEKRTRDKSNAAGPLFAKRGQLLPRERLGHLLDVGAPFLELSTLAGYCLDAKDPAQSIPGGGLLAGIGYVSGVRVMVLVDDAGIEAGEIKTMGMEKLQR